MRAIIHPLCLVTACLTAGLSLAAGPSDKNPQALLTPWTDESVSPKAVEWYTNAAELYSSCLEEIAKYEAAVEDGKTKSLDLIKVSMTKAKMIDLDQYARRLVDWGEPVGHDLSLRFSNLDRRLEKVRVAMLDTHSKKIQAGLPVLQKSCKQKEKTAVQTRKLIADGKLDAAEKGFQGTYRGLVAMACWFEIQQRASPMNEFDTTHENLNNAISAANKKDAQSTIGDLRDKTRPDLSKLPESVQAAAKELASAAEVEFGDKQLNGPKVFMAAAKEWHSLERATLRTIALNWAVYRQDLGIPVADPVVKQYADFRTAMIDGFKALVEADAARATEAEASELYLAYVKNIADIAAATRDDEMMSSLSGPLGKLADKSPSLAADAAAYRGATADWLRWRSRAAQTAAKAAGASAVTLPVPSAEATRLDREAPLVVKQVSDELLDKTALVSGGLLVTAKEGKPTSGLVKHVFVHAASAPLSIQQALEDELLVSKDLAPLTVEAAQAIAEAKRGALVEAGGKIIAIELDGVIPFFSIKGPDQNAVAPVGALPELANMGYDAPPQYLLIAAEMQPTGSVAGTISQG